MDRLSRRKFDRLSPGDWVPDHSWIPVVGLRHIPHPFPSRYCALQSIVFSRQPTTKYPVHILLPLARKLVYLDSVHFVIMGCGRVGALLADQLDADGHSVSIIDMNPDAFMRLSPDFSGQRVTGNGFDRGTLKKARIGEAYAFAAVSNGDNSNIIATRTVAEEFGVDHVVARVSDPERAALYERLGIPTIASARRTGEAILRRLLPPNAETVWSHPTGYVSLIAVRPSPGWYGTPFRKIEERIHSRIAFVSRMSRITVAEPRMVVQKDDELYVAIPGTNPDEVRDLLVSDPESDES